MLISDLTQYNHLSEDITEDADPIAAHLKSQIDILRKKQRQHRALKAAQRAQKSHQAAQRAQQAAVTARRLASSSH